MPDEQTRTIQQAIDLAVQHHHAGRLSEAESISQKILRAFPNQPVALHLLGVIAHQTGKNEIAVNLIAKALSFKLDYAEAHNSLGNILKKMGNLNEAVINFHKALALKPDFNVVHSSLGDTLSDLGRLDEAFASYKEAHAINPNDANLNNNLGVVLTSLGRFEGAVAYFYKALAIRSDFSEAHSNLGISLQNIGRLDEAVACFHKALAINPDFAMAHFNLGNSLLELGKLDDAVTCYHKALAIEPEFAKAHSNLIVCMSYILEITGNDILVEARKRDALHGYRGEIHKHLNTPEPNRQLRVGLVSGDLRCHSVSYFLENILSEMDQKKIKIFAYATSDKEDDLTARLKTSVSKWQKVTGLADTQLVNDIIADGIDILIDLSGHTKNNRLTMFSHKPAPIQATWLGYGGTTGVEAMDYVFCDSIVLPPSEEAHFVEKPWRLPDIWVCFSPPGLNIDSGPLPALANGHITFGSFNNLTKITDGTVACWAKILKAIPDSRLLLKTKQLKGAKVQEETRARFEAHEIAGNRLILKSLFPSMSEHLSTYNEIDIALDPFPYAGAATTIEALWMGTPVLTLKGDRFVSHMGESLVKNVGLEPWIADTRQDYVEKACAFASDLEALSVLRNDLRNILIDSPICDAHRFAENLEDAFREMWREWCAKKSA